jgi:hypothetical protein
MDAKGYLELLKRPVEKIVVPQWGEVLIRGLSSSEYDRYERASYREVPGKGVEFHSNTAVLVRYGVVNDAGQHVFSDDDLPALADKLTAEIARPLRAGIFKLCGVGVDVGKS